MIEAGQAAGQAPLAARRIIAPSRKSNALGYALVAFTGLLCGMIPLHIWHADLRIPLYYANAGDVFGQIISSMFTVDHWSPYVLDPRLGAPLALNTPDYPSLSELHFLCEKLLQIVVVNPFVAFNLYFLALFPLSAVTAFYALRRIGLPNFAAFAPAVLFAVLPYRFFRGESHLFISAYWVVPLILLACIDLANNGEWWRRRTGRVSITPTRAGLYAAICSLLIASDTQYSAAFALFFIGLGALIGTLRSRTWRPIIGALAMTLIIGLTLAAQAAPVYFFQKTHGVNAQAYQRYPEESQYYGLQIAELLLPVPGHRIPKLASIRSQFDARNPFNNESSWGSLGAIGSIGFLLLLTVLAAGIARPLAASLQTLSVFNVSAVLLATIGGFGAIISYYFRADIRAYNRISPFIAFLSLAVIGWGLAWLGRRFESRIPFTLRWVVVAVLIVAGTFDQTTAAMVPPYAADRAEFARDSAFGAAAEARLPAGSAVFELPYQGFPLGIPVGTMNWFDEFRPYLHTSALRWSFGANTGRPPAQWDIETASLAPLELVHQAVVAGFRGICVFRHGYPDNGASLETALRAITGPPIAVSTDQSLALYSLVKLSAAAEDSDPRIGTPGFTSEVVQRSAAVWGDGFYAEEKAPGRTWHWSQGRSSLILDNEESGKSTVKVAGTVVIPAHTASISIGLNGRPVETLTAGPDGAAFNLALSIPPGQSALSFETQAPPVTTSDPRALVFMIANPTITFPAAATSTAFDRAYARLTGHAANDALIPGPVDQFGNQSLHFVRGCSQLETAPNQAWHWCEDSATLEVTSVISQRVTLSATASTPGEPEAEIRLSRAGSARVVRGHPAGVPVSESFVVTPYQPQTIKISTTARRFAAPADPRRLFLRLDNLKISAATGSAR